MLDLGCGAGRPIGQALADAGYDIVGIDESQEMLALAREHVSSGQFICAEMVAARFGGSYDGVVCWDALFHLERGRHQTVLRKVFTALNLGGRFIFTVGGSENPPFHDEMFGQSFFFDSHAPEETLRLIREVGFEIVRAELVDKPDGGRDKGRLAIVADKPGG